MAGGVDQVEDIGLSIAGGITQTGRLGLDGDPPFPLQVHAVEDLVGHVTHLHRPGPFDQAISQSTFAVVNVGDDGKISDSIQC